MLSACCTWVRERCSWSTAATTGAAITSAGAVALRVLSPSPVIHALSSLWAGAGVQHCIVAAAPKSDTIRQVSRAVIGQSLLFFLTTLGGNYDEWRPTTDSLIVSIFGANLYLFAEWMVQERGRLHIDSTPLMDEKEPCFEGLFLNPIPRDALRLLIAAGTGTGAYVSTDLLAQSLLGTVSTYCITRIIGDLAMSQVHLRISNQDRDERTLPLSHRTGSKWRTAALALHGLSVIAIPFALFPYSDAGSDTRLRQLPAISAIVALCDSCILTSITERIQKTPIAYLDELQPMESRAYRNWVRIWPSLVACGLGAFCSVQIVELDDPILQGAMAGLLGGFTLSSAIFHRTDATWPADRNFWKDKIITSTLTQRPFGIPLALIFFLITNAVPMNDTYMAHASVLAKVAAVTGWTVYGAAWAWELPTKRVGPAPNLATLVYINGTLSWIRLLKGNIP